MPTIAKTKRYHELEYRHRKLIQLYSVMSELRLHTNKAVSVDTSSYYWNKLYNLSDYSSFLTASMESMMQIFYIELDGLIGAFWDSRLGRTHLRADQGSLARYLYDGTRIGRKRKATAVFESLLQNKVGELNMIHSARHKLAHFEGLSVRNSALVPGGEEVREILNGLADVLFLLGFQRWNHPHYIEQDSKFTESTQEVIDQLLSDDGRSKKMRKEYLEARKKWFDS